MASNAFFIHAFPTYETTDIEPVMEDKRVMIPMPKWPNFQVLKNIDPNLGKFILHQTQ